MSVFLTPELKPFYGGTYWPPRSRAGMPGFLEVLDKVQDAWVNRREDVLRGAGELTDAVTQMGRPQGTRVELDESILENACRTLLRAADRTHGGFGNAPKFPHAMDLRLLLRGWKRFGNEEALDVVRLTLDKMSHGGIYDHLGGGFHRYSTDARWLVPHFEKMLYDNALLAPVYLEAYQATGEQRYAEVVRETLDYVLREMTHPDGGFYSTQDADSEGVEGKFFVWSEEEILEHLGAEKARLFSYCYDITPRGNWEGQNILNRVKPHAQAAKLLDIDEDELAGLLSRCRQTLYDVRSKRIAPGRDEKVLAGWNGLMISAFARAAGVLGEATYRDAARRGADFLLERLQTDDGRLRHSFQDGRARFNAYLDDYACAIDALVDVYEATFDDRYVGAALALSEPLLARFHDAEAGGFFYTSDDHERLVARNKDSQDNATPSGNSMAATALLRLGRLTGRTDLETKGVDVLEMLSGQLAQVPMAGGQALIALDFLLGPTHEVVVVDGDQAEESAALLAELHRRFLPNKVLLRRLAGTNDDALSSSIGMLLRGKTSLDGAPTVYLCERGTCQAPVIGVKGLRAALDG
jgi:hypothetical protein